MEKRHPFRSSASKWVRWSHVQRGNFRHTRGGRSPLDPQNTEVWRFLFEGLPTPFRGNWNYLPSEGHEDGTWKSQLPVLHITVYIYILSLTSLTLHFSGARVSRFHVLSIPGDEGWPLGDLLPPLPPPKAAASRLRSVTRRARPHWPAKGSFPPEPIRSIRDHPTLLRGHHWTPIGSARKFHVILGDLEIFVAFLTLTEWRGFFFAESDTESGEVKAVQAFGPR